MVRKQLTQTILKFLRENGEASTRTVYEHVNNSTKWGASINAVGQILTRHADIEEVAEDHYTSFTGGKKMTTKIWKLKNL
tara:strand:- start:396 stop:635 length:240 start_codon:yes stop_codon:yes gene_type:complete